MPRGRQWGMDHSGSQLVLSGALYTRDVSAALASAQGINSLRGYTCVRSIGRLTIRPLAPSSSGILIYRCGLILLDRGAQSSTDPAVDNADYMWYHAGAVGEDGSETSSGFFGAHTIYVDYDVRSQRVVRQQEQAGYFVFRNSSPQSLTISHDVRSLYLLP